MKTFNLRMAKQKKPEEGNTDCQLQSFHKEAPNEITDGQLKSHRAEAPEVLLEKQLDKLRQEEQHMTTEAKLNRNKSDFGTKYRDEKAFTGKISKLEEKRLANKPAEKEKYEPASSIPKSERWWEKIKKANNSNLSKVAQNLNEENQDDSVNPDSELIFEKTKQRLDEKKRKELLDKKNQPKDQLYNPGEGEQLWESPDTMWQEIDEGVNTDDSSDKTEFSIDEKEPEQSADDKLNDESSQFIRIHQFKEINKPNLPYAISIAIEADQTAWPTLQEAKEAMVEKIVEMKPNLAGKISADDIDDTPSFPSIAGIPTPIFHARLIGDEYKSQDIEFEELLFDVKEDSGAKFHYGSIYLMSDEIDETKLMDAALTFIQKKHPDLEITEENLTWNPEKKIVRFIVADEPEGGYEEETKPELEPASLDKLSDQDPALLTDPDEFETPEDNAADTNNEDGEEDFPIDEKK